jgi:hypothetical protein
MKQVLMVVAMVVVFNAVLVFSGALDRLVQVNEDSEQVDSVDPDIVDVFQFTLQDEVRKKIGQPIEGFEPQMYLQVFPGLTETDFDGVEASIGTYRFVDGQLQYQNDNTRLQHSAGGAVTRKGIETLLQNVTVRAGIDLGSDGTITDVMSVLTTK